MGKVIEFYKKYNKGFKIAGGAISALAIFWSIYTYFVPINQNPNITIYIKNASNVFELNSQNKDIKILFRDKDVLKEKLNLRVTTLKIINDGKSDIAPNNFDLINEPFGIGVFKGKIISAEIDDPSLNSLLYIQDKTKSDSVHFIFKSFIFPKKQFFFVRMTILYSVDKGVPLMYPMGRIANAGIHLTNEEENNNTWKPVIGILIGFGVIFGTLALIAEVIERLKLFISKRRKRTITRVYQLYFKDEPNYKDAIINIYTKKGMRAFKIFRKATLDKGQKLMKSSSYDIIGILRDYKCCTAKDGITTFKDDFLQEINQIEKFI